MEPFYVAILLYFAAVLLAGIDLFVPSGGMLLILGAVAAIGCVLFAFQSGQTMGMAMLTIVVATIPVFVAVAIRIWPRTPIGRRIILGLPDQHPRGEQEVSNESTNEMIGLVLEAESPIMPAGQFRYLDRFYSVAAETGFIEVGKRFEIVGFKNRNFIARETQLPLSSKDGVVSSPSNSARADLPVEDLLEIPADQLGLDALDEDTNS